MASIIALHNTSPRRLRFANKLGGMPCPSIAYINTDHLYEDFGDISLLFSADVANPAQSHLFVCDSDIYSSRFPTVNYTVDEQELGSILARSIEISNDFSSSGNLVTRVSDFLESNAVEEAGFGAHRFPELFLQFEEEVLKKRYSPKDWKEKKPRFRSDLSSRPRIKEWVNNHFKENQTTFFDRQSPAIDELKQLISEEIDELAQITADAISQNSTSNYSKNKDYNYFKKAFEKDYFGGKTAQEATLSMNLLASLESDYKQWSLTKNPLDVGQLEDYIRSQSDNVKVKFDKWLNDTLSPAITKAFFYHATPAGNYKKKELTLDNVVSSMKRALRGGENFNYGAGNVRAQVSNEFRSWRALESRSHILTSESEFEATKEEFKERLFELAEELEPFYKFEGGFGLSKTNDISDIIAEYAGGKISSLSEGFNLDDDFPREKIDDFIRDIKHAPTQYFEGKFKKEVLLSDFAAAVIPNDIVENANDIIDILKRNDIPYAVYDPEIPQDREEKIKAIGDKFKLTRHISHQNQLVAPN